MTKKREDTAATEPSTEGEITLSTAGSRRRRPAPVADPRFVKEFGSFKRVEIINQREDTVYLGEVGGVRMHLGSSLDAKSTDPEVPNPRMVLETRLVIAALKNATFRSVFEGLYSDGYISIHVARDVA